MAKNNEFMHVTNAVQSLLYSDDFLYGINSTTKILVRQRNISFPGSLPVYKFMKIEFSVPILDLLDQKMASS